MQTAEVSVLGLHRWPAVGPTYRQLPSAQVTHAPGLTWCWGPAPAGEAAGSALGWISCLSPAGILLSSLSALSLLLLRVLSLLSARLCPRPAMSPLQQRTEGNRQTDRRLAKAGAESGEYLREWCHRRGEPCPGLFAAAAPETGGRVVTRAGGGAGRGRGCPVMDPRAPVNGLHSPGCTPAWGWSVYSRFSIGWGRARRGPGEKSNLTVTEPAFAAGGETEFTGKDDRRLES